MVRLLLALAFLFGLGSAVIACESDRYPWLDCTGGLVAQAQPQLRQALANGADANGNAILYSALVDLAAVSAGVPAHIAHAVVRIESNYDPHRRGAAGEWGIGQIFCATARGIGFAGRCDQLAEASINLRYAMAYLRLALDRGGDGCAGASLYNLGIAARPRCTAYGRRVIALARR